MPLSLDRPPYPKVCVSCGALAANLREVAMRPGGGQDRRLVCDVCDSTWWVDQAAPAREKPLDPSYRQYG